MVRLIESNPIQFRKQDKNNSQTIIVVLKMG